MLTIDRKGLRSKKVNGVEIDDFREIARLFTKNPKFLDKNGEGKSIYLIPDNYIHDIKQAAFQLKGSGRSKDKHRSEGGMEPGFHSDEGDSDSDIERNITESKSKSGRAGRKIKKKDVSFIKHLHDALSGGGMPEEDLDEYINYIQNESTQSNPWGYKKDEVSKDRKSAIKIVYKKSKVNQKEGNGGPFNWTPQREINFSIDELDWPDETSEGGVAPGEIVPLPITNFTKEQIDNIKNGKTGFFIKKKDTRKGGANETALWKEVYIKGNHVEDLKQNGYNGEEVYLSEDQAKSEEDKGRLKEPWFLKYKPTGIEMVEITYIYGPNRSGKTYYGAKYATLWSEMFENWPIFLFSRRDQDKVLDDIVNTSGDRAVSRVAIDESLITNPLSMLDFEHSLVIFDDIDTIADKKICKAVQKLRDDIMETGRQKMIYVINTSHLGANYMSTRTVLNEANSYTLFPRKGNYEHNCRILKEKMGMKPDMVRKIMDRPDGIAYKGKWGWVTVYKDSPQYIISESGVRLL